MQLDAANRVICSANEVPYPVKWDRMLVKGSRVCTIPRHERDLFRSISKTVETKIEGEMKSLMKFIECFSLTVYRSLRPL